jgi:hypothetical protein
MAGDAAGDAVNDSVTSPEVVGWCLFVAGVAA